MESGSRPGGPKRSIFGKAARAQVGDVIRGYVAARFASSAEAARSLGISRARLSSYTTGKSFPGADVIDLIHEKWGLELVRTTRAPADDEVRQPSDREIQGSLFDIPVTVTGDTATVVLERRGSGVSVRIEISGSTLKMAS